MRHFIFAAAISLVFALVLSAQIMNKFKGLAGSETGYVSKVDGDRYYFFKKLIVHSKYNSLRDGENLAIYYRTLNREEINSFRPKSLSSLPTDLLIEPEKQTFLYGVNDDYLFLEQKINKDDRKLIVHNMKEGGKVILNVLYTAPVSIKKNKSVHYYKVTQQKKAIESLCPQSKGWHDSGYESFAAGQMKFSLISGREYFTGKKVCRIKQ